MSFLLILALLGAAPPADTPAQLVITNPGAALPETPILIPVPAKFQGLPDGLTFGVKGTQNRGAILIDGGKTQFAAVLPALGPGQTTLDLATLRTEPPDDVVIQPHGSNVAIQVQNHDFTTLNNDLGPKPILYPLIGPADIAMTRDYPMKDSPGEDKDHPHHRSFWFTHGDVNKIDFWTEAKGHGTIHQTAILTARGGNAVGILRTANDWLGPDGAKVCEDERTFWIWGTSVNRILDFEILLKATVGPVVLGDTKEGSFGLRLASPLDANRKPGGTILNSNGEQDVATWGKAADWVDYSGNLNSKPVGVAIFDHPQSFRHPTTWHVRDYGLFAANPFGYHDFKVKKPGQYTIPQGDSIRFRYRVILHAGDAATAHIADAYRGYAEPLQVELR